MLRNVAKLLDRVMRAYFPYRAVKNRPYFDEFIALPREERKWDVLTQIALSRTRRAFGEDHKHDPHVHACCMREARLASDVADFFTGGQVVFHIAAPLRDAFLTSDLGDAQASDLRFPFEVLYMHLGTDLDIPLNGGVAKLEGAFLHRRDGTNEVGMTLVGPLNEPPAHWGERGMESFTFFFSEEEAQRPLLQALSEKLDREARDPETVPELSLDEFPESEQASIREAWASQTEDRELNARNRATALEAAKLVANALLYLAQYPQDVEEAWQEGTPKGFTDKFERSDGKTRERVLSKARSSGFTRIRKVGKLFETAEAGEHEAGASPAPHLRRAHWRRQAYGPGFSLRKLMWIRAMRVLGGTVRERPYLMAEDQAMPKARGSASTA
jgi:hypothetical protein